MLSVAVLAIPVATGFAVLRYRLYDIDLVIGTPVKAGVLAGGDLPAADLGAAPTFGSVNR